MKKNNLRNYGIDLLRIYAMLCVAILHILGHGAVLQNAATTEAFGTAWLLEIIAYPAVNCFVLISGFVGFREDNYCPRLKNIISLFMTVVFYGVCIVLFFNRLHPAEIGRLDMINTLFPISTRQYWFFSCYFGMFLLSPMINLFVAKADKKILKLTALSIVFLFTVPTLFKEPFSLGGGYSVIWFVLLYLLGAIIKKLKINEHTSLLACIPVTLFAFAATWGLKMLELAEINKSVALLEFLKKHDSKFISYCSPLLLIASVGLLCIFSRIKVHKIFHFIINFFSKTAFSVYLIHDNPFMRKYAITGRFAAWAELSPKRIIFNVLATAVLIFLVCSLVDGIRILIFKLIRADGICSFCERIIKNAADKIFGKKEVPTNNKSENSNIQHKTLAQK